MYKAPLNFATAKSLCTTLFPALFSSSMLILNFGTQPAAAQVMEFCQLSAKAVKDKQQPRLSALKGNKDRCSRSLPKASKRTLTKITRLSPSKLVSNPSYLVAFILVTLTRE
jgi:hypothetical protein